MNRPCDCCEGAHVAMPGATPNPPGLDKLQYRIGTHASFLQTMIARLSSVDYPALAALKTREASDAAIALLDAWAVVGDVLTFYQERIANEGYLRTACERRSILELGRLVGYALRPGVSASVYLAYMMDKGADPVVIPAGALSNSVPGPGEQQQAFETSDALEARPAWSMMLPRATRLQRDLHDIASGLFLQGTATKLAVNDPILLQIEVAPKLYFVNAITVDSANARTVAMLRDSNGVILTDNAARPNALGNVVDALRILPSLPPADASRLPRNMTTIFAAQADTTARLLTSFSPLLSSSLYGAWRHLPPSPPPQIQAYALRVEAQPFGHNAPLRQIRFNTRTKFATLAEWEINDPWNIGGGGGSDATSRNTETPPAPTLEVRTPQPDQHTPTKLFLDNDYEIAPTSYVAVVEAGREPIITQPTAFVHRSLYAYGMSGKTVEIDLPNSAPWFALDANSNPPPYAIVRTTRVYTGSEELALGQMPIAEDVAGSEIELDGLYEALQPGRLLIVAGNRSDVGVPATELVMVAAVAQKMQTDAEGNPYPGESTHTFITLAEPLAYRYVRSSVTIYGNVVKATNGQTRQEVLGSGDATRSYQTFTLKQWPLTYVSAPTVTGAQSTLVARVNDVQWRETDTLAELGPKDRNYATKIDDAALTTLVFGDGVHGARLPTGTNNVSATYRSGMGKGGNVRPDQVTLLSTRPLGVKNVTNPMRGSGGADRESGEAARKNVPVALMALDRLVSITDYADFTRAFAGVGKAAARFMPGKQQRRVQVVIAGADDAPIDANSDLFANLYAALHKFGDPYLPIEIVVRTRKALVISANVKIDPDYDWKTLEPKIRAAVVARFTFDQVGLGDSVYLADAIAAIQATQGVLYVDIDVFDAIGEDQAAASFTQQQATILNLNGRLDAGDTGLIYLTADVPDTLVLQEVTP